MVLPFGCLFVLVALFVILVVEYLYEAILRISIGLTIKRGVRISWDELPDNIKRKLDKVSPYIRSYIILYLSAVP